MEKIKENEEEIKENGEEIKENEEEIKENEEEIKENGEEIKENEEEIKENEEEIKENAEEIKENEDRNIQHSSSFNSNDSDDKSSEDLTTSLLSVNDEENELLNNYKYNEDTVENIAITVNEFMKLLNEYPELLTMMNNVKKDIQYLPELMIYLKEKNYKLALNLMDYPQNCFEQIFELIKNNNINSKEYEEEIKNIQDIVPYVTKEQIIEALEVCNKDVELSINYLYDNI